jgi:hypothetical protein
MRTLKLVVDIDRTADGHIEGRIQAPGEPALPFSGRLELLRAIEDALPAAEPAAPAPGPAGDEEGTRRSPRDQKYQARPIPQGDGRHNRG